MDTETNEDNPIEGQNATTPHIPPAKNKKLKQMMLGLTSDADKQMNVFDASKYQTNDDIPNAITGDSISSASGTTIRPTIDSLIQRQERQKWLENLSYQRENHEQACQTLEIPNTALPRIKGVSRSVLLKFWQPVAIAALLQMYQKPCLRGAILADAMGLGKTWETIGFVLRVSRVSCVRLFQTNHSRSSMIGRSN